MLQTLHFLPRPDGFCQRVLGVIASQNSTAHEVHFSVPAHVLLTLNVVRHGTLQLANEVLPQTFATGAHTRSRRYRLSAGATVLTLFCRADAAPDLCQVPTIDLTDSWLPAQQVFNAWHEPRASADALACSSAMFACVAPQVLPPRRSESGQQMADALHGLTTQGVPAVAQHLHMSERSLQRLFLAQWGISPKLVQRMLRVQHCMSLWQEKGESLAELASQAGLADQAHLAREFRQLVGCAPSHLKRTPSSSQDDALWALRTGHTLLAPLLPH